MHKASRIPLPAGPARRIRAILPLLPLAAVLLSPALPVAAEAAPSAFPAPAAAPEPAAVRESPDPFLQPASGFPGLESVRQGRKVVLDWAVAESAPARFRILHPDGRLIATRNGKRSAQGWIASVRVAGWPSGLYLVTAEAGATRSSRTLYLH